MENFDVNALKTLKSTLDSLNLQTQDIQKKNVGPSQTSDISNTLLGENKSVTMLEEINKEFGDTLSFLDNKILAMKEKIENSKNENIKGEQKGAKSKKQVNNSNI